MRSLPRRLEPPDGTVTILTALQPLTPRDTPGKEQIDFLFAVTENAHLGAPWGHRSKRLSEKTTHRIGPVSGAFGPDAIRKQG